MFTRLSIFVGAVICATGLAVPARLSGQTSKPNPLAPVLSPVFPAGMQRGATREIVLQGKNLQRPTGLWISFPAKWSIPKDKNNGARSSQVRIRLRIPADAPIGWHALRLATESGMSNLQMFCIDDLPQVTGSGKNRSRKTAQRLPGPCVVDARIAALASDFYLVSVRKKARLSFEVLARRLGGPLDPQLSLISLKSGREIAHAGDSPGLMSDCRFTHQFKEPGDYLLQIKDVLNRGGNDYVYRLRIGTFPLATAPLPMAVQRGRSNVTIRFAGREMNESLSQKVSVPDDFAANVKWISPRELFHGWPVALRISDHSEAMEREPNNDRAKANPIHIPSGTTGRFHKYADMDFFRFRAKKGQKLLIQAHTLEQYSPAFIYLVVQDGKGKQLANSTPKENPPADQRIQFTPPADGEYYVYAQHLNYKGGADQVYRLTATPVADNFAVRAGLDRWDVAQDGSRLIPIQVTRGGFSGPITVTAKTQHAGISGKLTVRANAKSGRLRLRVRKDTPIGAYTLQLQAQATINGKKHIRLVSAASAVRATLAGLPYPPEHLTTGLALAVTPRPPFRLQVTLSPKQIKPGGRLNVTVTATRDAGFAGPIAILPPQGIPGKQKLPKISPIAKGKKSTKFSIRLNNKTPLGKRALAIAGRGKVNGADRIAYAPPALLEIRRK